MDIYKDYPDLNNPDYIEHYSFEKCYTVKNPDGAIAEQDIAVALLQTMGNIGAAARLLQRPRRHLQGFIARNKKVEMLIEDIEADFLDSVETAHKEAALMGDGKARTFFLNTLGKDRGYSTRSELTGKDGEALQPATFDASKLSTDALAELAEAMENGSE